MKKTKKILAVVIALVLTFSCMSVLAYSERQDYVPTIIIPGLFSSLILALARAATAVSLV